MWGAVRTCWCARALRVERLRTEPLCLHERAPQSERGGGEREGGREGGETWSLILAKLPSRESRLCDFSRLGGDRQGGR